MHKMIMAVIVVAIMATCSLPLYAEIYQGIGPLDTLGDVKAKFPNAKYVKTKLAWAKDTDAIYEVTGQGIYGLMMINFQDLRPLYRQTAVDDPDKKEIYEKFVNESDDEALTVIWVRWVPDVSIPLERVISKYGKPDIKDFTQELIPTRLWSNKGMLAALTDDEKKVIFIQFGFSKDDYRKAWMSKHGYIPSYLKEKEPAKNQKKKK